MRARTRLGALLLALLLLSTGRLPAAGAAAGGPLYPLVFPVAGAHVLTDSFGDARGRSRSHEGVDILAERMVAVVAVADGEVRWVHDERGGNCCDVALLHDDGWRSRYIHLNNDTPGTDDGRAVGIAPGVREGARVVAGEVIGWVGDSGNAEATTPHLHFELRRPDGRPVDPFPSLVAAKEGGRELVPAEPPMGGGEEPRVAGRERRPGLLERIFGRAQTGEEARERAAEVHVPSPSRPMPPAEGEPALRPDEPPPGALPTATGDDLEMRHRVELVVDDDCCEGYPTEEEIEAGRRPGWIACFGFERKERGRQPAEGR